MNCPLSLRVNPANPNHHLWNNHGTWYIHYTVCPTPWTAQRVRKSLKTRDLAKARLLRDRIFGKAGKGGNHVCS